MCFWNGFHGSRMLVSRFGNQSPPVSAMGQRRHAYVKVSIINTNRSIDTLAGMGLKPTVWAVAAPPLAKLSPATCPRMIWLQNFGGLSGQNPSDFAGILPDDEVLGTTSQLHDSLNPFTDQGVLVQQGGIH